MNGSRALSADTSIQGLAYFQNFSQRISNGATADLQPCDNGTGALCNDDGSEVTGYGDAIVPDFLNGALYSNLVLEDLDPHGFGALAQLANDSAVVGHANHFVGGTSFDGSDSVFGAATYVGGYNAQTQLFGGLLISTEI